MCIRDRPYTVSEPKITNNRVKNNFRNGIHVYHNLRDKVSYFSPPIMILNNVVDLNGAGGGNYDGIKVVDSAAEIKNNTIVSNVDDGIEFDDSTYVLMVNVVNNIIANHQGSSRYGFVEASGLGIVEIFYNNLWQNGPLPNSQSTQVSVAIANYPTNIWADPQFADSEYHVLLSSPTIDSGDPVSSYYDQWDRDDDKKRNDMGAYGGPYLNEWNPVIASTHHPRYILQNEDFVFLPLGSSSNVSDKDNNESSYPNGRNMPPFSQTSSQDRFIEWLAYPSEAYATGGGAGTASLVWDSSTGYPPAGSYLISYRVYDTSAPTTDTPMGGNTTYSWILHIQSAPTMEVSFSEINWAGSSASYADEWVELYNNSDQDVNLNGWTIENLGDSESPNITINSTICSNTVIPANGYFLISNYGSNNGGRTNPMTLLNVNPDCVTTRIEMTNKTGEVLKLKDSSGSIVDQTPSGTWAAGRVGSNSENIKYVSMVRKNLTSDGRERSNWQDARQELNLQHQNPVAGYSSWDRGLVATPKVSEHIGYEAELMYSKGSRVSDPSASGGYATTYSAADCMSQLSGNWCYVSYGPQSSLESEGRYYKVSYTLKVSDNTNPNPVLLLAVTDNRKTVQKRVLSGTAFDSPGSYKTFTIYYKKGSGSADYIVRSYGIVDVTVDKIEVTDLGTTEPESTTYEAETMERNVGSVVSDLLASGGKSVVSGTSSGLMNKNMDSQMYRTDSNYKARFYIKVSNNSLHKPIGRIEVYNRGGNFSDGKNDYTTCYWTSGGALINGFVSCKIIYADEFANTSDYQQVLSDQFTGPSQGTIDARFVYYASSGIEVSYDRVELVRV